MQIKNFKILKLQWLNSPTRWKDSFTVGCAILAMVETFFAISAVSHDTIWGKNNWIIKFLFVFGFFLFIVIITFIFKYHNESKMTIVVLYNATTVDKSKCPDVLKYVGTHTAMCYRENGQEYWDYQAVKTALGQ